MYCMHYKTNFKFGSVPSSGVRVYAIPINENKENQIHSPNKLLKRRKLQKISMKLNSSARLTSLKILVLKTLVCQILVSMIWMTSVLISWLAGPLQQCKPSRYWTDLVHDPENNRVYNFSVTKHCTYTNSFPIFNGIV